MIVPECHVLSHAIRGLHSCVAFELSQKFAKREAVTGALGGGNITVPDDMAGANVITQHQAATEPDQRSHLLLSRSDRSFFTIGIISTIEIANYRNSQVRIVAFGVRPLALFRSSGLNAAVG